MLTELRITEDSSIGDAALVELGSLSALQVQAITPYGHNYMGNKQTNHDYICHNYIGHNYISLFIEVITIQAP